MFIEKVYIGLDHAPPSFDLRARILGQGGTNLDFIRNETGAVVILKGGVSDKFEPLHLFLQHAKQEAVASARLLALNLVDTVKQELQQWSAGSTPPSGPPHFDQSQPPPQILQSNAQISGTPAAPAAIQPPVIQAFAPQQQMVPLNQAGSNVVAMRPQYIQVLPQQHMVLTQLQDGSHQYVISNPGSTILNPSNAIAMPIQSAQFANNTVDLSNLQHLPVRLGTIPTFLQNGITLSQFGNQQSEQNQNTQTFQALEVASPSVCSASTLNSASQQVYVQASNVPQVGGEKCQDGKEQIQWLPTPVYIPYQYQAGVQQAQQIFAVPQGIQTNLSNLNVWSNQLGASQLGGTVVPIQLSSQITPTATSIAHTQPQQLQATAQQINAWQSNNPAPSNSVQTPGSSGVTTINVWSSGTRTQPPVQNIAAKPTASKQSWQQTPLQANNANAQQENRGIKRSSDGNTLSLRPIAPAGSANQNDHRNQPLQRDTKQKNWSNQTGNIATARLNPRNPQEIVVSHNPNFAQLTQVKQNEQSGQDQQAIRNMHDNSKFVNYGQKFPKQEIKDDDEKNSRPPSSPNIPAYVIPRNPEQFHNQYGLEQGSMQQSNQPTVSTIVDSQGGQITLHSFDSGNMSQIPANAQYHFIPNNNQNQTYTMLPPSQGQTYPIIQQLGQHVMNSQSQYNNGDQYPGPQAPNQVTPVRTKFTPQHTATPPAYNTQSESAPTTQSQNYLPPSQTPRFTGQPNQNGSPQLQQSNQSSQNQFSMQHFAAYGNGLPYPTPPSGIAPPNALPPPPNLSQPNPSAPPTANYYWQGNN